MGEKPAQVIALAGGSGSGKTTLARGLRRLFAAEGCVIIGQDSYYIDQSAKFDRDGGAVNFDHPDALDFQLLAAHLRDLKAGRSVDVPVYDFATHTRLARTEQVKPTPIILVDGTLILSRPELIPLFDEAVFLAVDEDTRFVRRLKRDVEERGRKPDGVREQFFKQVKLMHDHFVEPSQSAATILIRDGAEVLVPKPTDSLLQQRLVQAISQVLADQAAKAAIGSSSPAQ